MRGKLCIFCYIFSFRKKMVAENHDEIQSYYEDAEKKELERTKKNKQLTEEKKEKRAGRKNTTRRSPT